MHLDASQLSFLYRLGKSPEGQQLQVLISAEIDWCNVQLRKQSGEDLLREQGKALYLDMLMKWLTTDPSARQVSKRPMLIGSSA